VDDGVATTTLSPRQQLFPAFQAASVSPGSIAIERLAAEVANALVPTGAVIAFAGTPAQVPDGWLLCDGAELSETLYPELFSVIGISHGGGGGLFRLPDYRGRFLRGQDLGIGRDPNRTTRSAMATGGATGDTVGTVQGDAFQGHRHTLGSHAHTIFSDEHSHTLFASNATSSTGPRAERAVGDPATNGSLTAAIEADTHNHTMGSNASSMTNPSNLPGYPPASFAFETRPENAYVNYIIRCGSGDGC
jgi:microcystin-dependent protein